MKLKFIKNIKISQKLLLLIVISILLIGAVGVTGYKYMRDMAQGSEKMYNQYLISIDKLGKMQKNNFAIDSYTMEAMITTDTAEYNQRIESIDALVDENLGLESEELFPEEVIDIDTYYDLIGVYIEGRTTALEMAKTDKQEAYRYYLENVYDKRFELDDIVTNIQTYFSEKAEQINEDNSARIQSATFILLGVIIAGLALFILLGVLISRAIVNPIKTMQGLMAKAEQGELREGSYVSKDELGQLALSYNGMIEGIKKIIQVTQETSEIVVSSSEQLSASAKQSTQASEHISSTIQELAAGSDSQMQSVEETADIIDEMVSYTGQITKDTKEIADSANNSADKSIEGKQSIDKVTTQMSSINRNVAGLGDTIKKLSDHLNEIGSINKVITDIADQTNLLSLNAAIEAARAGEYGKGFAVVADEVRKLAEQSVHSAEQISSLIGMIENETNKTLESMDSAIQEVEEGTHVVRDAGEAFENIEDSISGVVKQIEQITGVVNELESGTTQVKQLMDLVKDVAEQSASSTQNVSAATEEQLASMEEIESSSTNLAQVSEELQGAISKFRV